MPYRHAHYFVGFVLLVILGGFWASYWSAIGRVPFAFHVHAISSSTWLLLLIVQSIAIHRRSNAFHKQNTPAPLQRSSKPPNMRPAHAWPMPRLCSSFKATLRPMMPKTIAGKQRMMPSPGIRPSSTQIYDQRAARLPSGRNE